MVWSFLFTVSHSSLSRLPVSYWPERISDTYRLCCCQSVNETSQRGVRSHTSLHHPPPGSVVSTPLITSVPVVCVCVFWNCVRNWQRLGVSCVWQRRYEKVAADRKIMCVLVCVHICGWVQRCLGRGWGGGVSPPIWTEVWELLSVSHFAGALWFSSSDRPQSGNWH